MSTHPELTCVAFSAGRLVARGSLRHVVREAKQLVDGESSFDILFFDDGTSEPVEIDLRGSVDEVLRRLPASPAPGTVPDGAGEEGVPRPPGRPRLGVVAREVTLLPRHWDWLATQPGGASAVLRRLVESARRAGAGEDLQRRTREAAYRFMNAMAGDEPGFEEACRALFAGNRDTFEALVESWPPDVRQHATLLAGRSFQAGCADGRS